MLKLSTKGRYGVRLMLELAIHYQKGPVALKDIAKRQEISLKYLEHLILPLKDAKLIRANRGAHGGYALLRSPADISLEDIVAALEGPVCVAECTLNPKICKRAKDCLSRGAWKELAVRITRFLSALTLDKLIPRQKFPSEDECSVASGGNPMVGSDIMRDIVIKKKVPRTLVRWVPLDKKNKNNKIEDFCYVI